MHFNYESCHAAEFPLTNSLKTLFCSMQALFDCPHFKDNLFYSKSGLLKVNLIQRHPHRNISIMFDYMSGHHGPVKLTYIKLTIDKPVRFIYYSI